MTDIKQAYREMVEGYNKYIGNSCEIMEALNEKFYSDELFEMIQDIIYQPGDGFVLVWDGNNSTFDIDDLIKLKTKEELEEYLIKNQIS